MRTFLFLLIALMCSPSTFAADFGFQDITSEDLKSITRETSAAFKHTSVSSASRSEKDFGAEAGIVAGDATISSTQNILSNYSATSIRSLPRAGVFLGLNLVKGLSAEAMYFPKTGNESISMSGSSFALKSNFNQFMDLSFDWAAKVHYGQSGFNWSQSVSSVTTDMSYKQSTVGLETQLSRKYGIFEPYINAGYLMSTGQMSSSGSTSVFDTSYSTNSSAEEKVSGLTYGLGVGASMAMMKFSIELMSNLSTTVTSFKASSTF